MKVSEKTFNYFQEKTVNSKLKCHTNIQIYFV